MVCGYGLPYTHSRFPNCHVNLEDTTMCVNRNSQSDVYYEELSSFNNQFITPAPASA